ncbi:MAG: nascent polypeptide-associated complex protein [Candidatus Thermoplasmatota archaeon]
MIPGMGAGMDPRQMSMMMKKLGIDVRDIEAVQSVTVRTATKDYVFDKASVSVMKAQGVETWQVSGKPRVVERGTAAPAMPGDSPQAPVAPTAAAEPLVIPDEDVALVAKETGRSPAEARKALEATNGDLAEAIVKLTS